MSDFDVEPIINLARETALAGKNLIATGRNGENIDLFAHVLKNGEVEGVHFDDLEEWAPRPFAMRGRYVTHDHESFIGVVGRHLDSRATTLWADKTQFTVTAVLDDHEANSDRVDAVAYASPRPAWGNHRAVLQLTKTPDWTHWTSADGSWLDQANFAEFIERGALNIIDPDAATFYEIAMNLRAKTGVDFKSSYVMESGELGFRYEETIDASANTSQGVLAIPRTFELDLQPFEGAGRYAVQARLMYRTGRGGLALGYKLIRPEEVLKQAFDDLRKEISTGLDDMPVYLGKPRDAGA